MNTTFRMTKTLVGTFAVLALAACNVTAAQAKCDMTGDWIFVKANTGNINGSAPSKYDATWVVESGRFKTRYFAHFFPRQKVEMTSNGNIYGGRDDGLTIIGLGFGPAIKWECGENSRVFFSNARRDRFANSVRKRVFEQSLVKTGGFAGSGYYYLKYDDDPKVLKARFLKAMEAFNKTKGRGFSQ